MKTKFIFLTIFLFGMIGKNLGQEGYSLSNKSGLFLTASDFSSGKLSYLIDCLAKDNKLKTSDFSNGSKIKITMQDTTIKLSKSAIWGYRICDGKEFRVYRSQDYEIIDKAAIIVYQKKETRRGNPKSNQSYTKTSYFFSENPESPLRILNLANIESSFLNNRKFHDLIDIYFKSDEELLIFDDYYKMMRLNHFYLESLR